MFAARLAALLLVPREDVRIRNVTAASIHVLVAILLRNTSRADSLVAYLQQAPTDDFIQELSDALGFQVEAIDPPTYMGMIGLSASTNETAGSERASRSGLPMETMYVVGGALFLCALLLCIASFARRRRARRASRIYAYRTRGKWISAEGFGTEDDRRRILSIMRIPPRRPDADVTSAHTLDSNDWIQYARDLVVQASGMATKPYIAVCDFDGEIGVDLGVEEGDEVMVFVASQSPMGWLIAEQHRRGLPIRRGLVPAAFVVPADGELHHALDKSGPRKARIDPMSEENAATRLQARQRGRRARKRTTIKVNGLLPASIYGLD